MMQEYTEAQHRASQSDRTVTIDERQLERIASARESEGSDHSRERSSGASSRRISTFAEPVARGRAARLRGALRGDHGERALRSWSGRDTRAPETLSIRAQGAAHSRSRSMALWATPRPVDMSGMDPTPTKRRAAVALLAGGETGLLARLSRSSRRPALWKGDKARARPSQTSHRRSRKRRRGLSPWSVAASSCVAAARADEDMFHHAAFVRLSIQLY